MNQNDEMTKPDAGTPTPKMRMNNLWRINLDESVNNFARSVCGEAANYLLIVERELTALRAAHEAAQAEIAELRELVRDANDLLDDARSGYISGCGEDLKWDKRREEFREAAREKS